LELETINATTGQLRFFLRSEEEKISGMLRGINKMLNNYRERPKHIFYHPEQIEVIENIVCPYCNQTNNNFAYDKPCEFCREPIGNPWKEHTICPNTKCSSIINRRELFEDP